MLGIFWTLPGLPLVRKRIVPSQTHHWLDVFQPVLLIVVLQLSWKNTHFSFNCIYISHQAFICCSKLPLLCLFKVHSLVYLFTQSFSFHARSRRKARADRSPPRPTPLTVALVTGQVNWIRVHFVHPDAPRRKNTKFWCRCVHVNTYFH